MEKFMSQVFSLQPLVVYCICAILFPQLGALHHLLLKYYSYLFQY